MPRESHRPGNRRDDPLLPPQKTPFKSSVKLPLNDDRQEKAVRFQSRQAFHDRQINSIKAAASPAKMRMSMGAAGSPRTPSDEDKENGNGHGIAVVGGNAVTPMKRMPILANFEEWMKMATDNKINATNSWNFALIDYFHDMSLLREGDSVNFQKASCTLDGCVKIYTSRVDSVATETGKLLSGLADSNSKKRNDGGNGEADGGEEGEEEEGEDGVKRRAKRKVQRSSEATLATSFNQLQLKKIELEFSVDPLFKKASADFDEGGAKGLLLNHLTMDGNGRIVFDSSDDCKDVSQGQVNGEEREEPAKEDGQSLAQLEKEADETHKAPHDAAIDMASLQQRFFPDMSKLDEQDICPSLKSFELDGTAESLNIPFLKAPEDWRKDHSPSKTSSGEDVPHLGDLPSLEDDNDDGDMGGFDVGMDVGFGEGGEAWAKEAAIDTQPRPFDNGFAGSTSIDEDSEQQVEGYAADSAQYGVTLSDDHDRENVLNYFDQALQKNWAGPEHWRIRKIKDVNKPAAVPRQRKEKEPFEIDFAAPLTQSMADAIYTPATNNSAICLPRSQWKSKTRNLLPDDKHFNSRQLLRLFLKPKARIGARRPGSRVFRGAAVENMNEGDMDEAFWARRHQEAAASLAAGEEAQAHGDYDANFFQDDGLGVPAGIEDDDEEFADAQEALPDLGGDSQPMSDLNTDGGATASQDGFGNQLVTQSRRLRPEYVQYARVAKKVDVRRLKEEMWRGIGLDDDRQQPTPGAAAAAQLAPLPKGPDETLKFSSVMNSLQSVYPERAMADISTSYCFICLLHLANEKGLVLGNEQTFEDLNIAKDHTAEIEENGV